MDSDQFDALAARLSGQLTRRHSLGLLGGLSAAGASLVHETMAKKKKKKKKKGKKATTSPPPTTAPPTTTPEPPCPSGQDRCGGACRTACPSGRVRNPLTCGCCRPSGLREHVCGTVERDPCCAPELACRTVDGGDSTACPGRLINDACSFGAQCASGFCNPNLVCA
jgi:hypothetical protein